MKFKSRKDLFMNTFMFVICGFLGLILLIRIINIGYSNLNFIFLDLFILASIGFFLWIYFGTEYQLTKTELKYRSGPISGEIKIEQINEIIKGETLWSGLKPATAKNGLIIKYLEYEEIYISPKTNESFINKILEMNKNIIITIK